MKKIRNVIPAIMVCVMCLIVGATAATNSETIQAVLSYGTTVKYNGQSQKLVDANRKPVYPIVYEGTTYLPVRAIAGMLGVAVDWDGTTSTVLLGEKDKTAITSDMFKDTGRNDMPFSTDKALFVVDGVAYDSGLVVKSDWASVGRDLKLDGKYSILHCLVANTGAKSTTFVVQDENNGVTLKELTLEPGESAKIDLDVRGISILNFGLDCKFSSGHSGIYTDMWLK